MSLVVHPSRFLHFNAGAFVSRGEACLVDPGITADEVAALLDRLDGAALRSVILTHSDWDHVLGPEHLPRSTVVAHESYPTKLDPVGVRVFLARLERRAGVERKHVFEPPLPDLTFTASTTLEVGGLTLHLEHAPGHTADMLTVYEPASCTLWAADVLSDVEIPLVAHDLEAYERTLERIAELEVATLVPGHGTPTSDAADIRRRLGEDRSYLAELRTGVADAIRSGLGLEKTVTALERIALRRSPEDDSVHRLNVETAYAGLGGDADPDEVGFARAWRQATQA
jgi:glyoxylase-like metal-dependent hydrolase (beta-lactamase superfamily II)